MLAALWRCCSFLVFAAVFLAAVFLGACRSADDVDVGRTDAGTLRRGPVEAVDTLARGVALEGRPLVLRGFQGSVHVRGTDASIADLRFVRRGRGNDPAGAREVLDHLAITESGTEEAYTYTLSADARRPPGYAAIDGRGTVPRSTALRVEAFNGPVRVDSVEGPMTVRRDHGPVAIHGAAATVEVDVKNGDLTVGFRSLPPTASVSLRTENGDVALALPSGASAQIDARTHAGVIRTRGMDPETERLRSLDAGGHYTADLGGGEASIELRTTNGSLSVQVGPPSKITGRGRFELSPPDTTVQSVAPGEKGADPDSPATDSVSRDTTGG